MRDRDSLDDAGARIAQDKQLAAERTAGVKPGKTREHLQRELVSLMNAKLSVLQTLGYPEAQIIEPRRWTTGWTGKEKMESLGQMKAWVAKREQVFIIDSSPHKTT